MSLSTTPNHPHFRIPSYIADSKPKHTSTFQAPLEDAFLGEWYMIRSSNNFWKDKRNVRLQYTTAGSHIEDRAFYQTTSSEAIKSIVGKDTRSEEGVGVYVWQGKGLLRVASSQWEVLSFTARSGGRDWMLVFAHPSIFTAAAINLMCRRKEGLGEEDMQAVEEWLGTVGENRFRQAVVGMVDIKQE
ncbi:hypothetical protein K458DRAFT_425819 [Lentithecium fluviatile CBS 122367]|uniref:Calycin-like protein n=1 Tax=Lentithecium fluviatile CBS 122367 TaxID=1168545 RepID=A0A6G1JP85_9PLEO|nr:hypothetical protein K458DRAFT_425819 [Lentithecium fluviatile CBS 122367]